MYSWGRSESTAYLEQRTVLEHKGGDRCLEKVKSKKKKKGSFSSRIKKAVQRDWQLYVLALPVLIYVIIFSYIPMYGIKIAFQDYNPSMGFANSPWVGFKHFTRFFNNYQFWDIMKNTLGLGFYSLIAGFFPPIILAILLHNTNNKKVKSVVQTISYAPHFISMVVMAGMILLMFSQTGVINTIISLFGGEKTNFMADPNMFPHVYVWSGVWQGTGWWSIIYLSALAGADQELYEAAKVDGANKWQRIIHLDIPALLPTAVIMLIMNCGSILTSNTQKVLLLQNNLNLSTSEIIGTMVYKSGMLKMQYSYSTAVGLFQTIVNVIFLVTVNKISQKLSDTSLW